MATVVGVTAMNVKTIVKKKKPRNRDRDVQFDAHFPRVAP